MKTVINQRLFLLLFLTFLVGCDTSDEPEELQLPEVSTMVAENDAVITYTSVEVKGAVSQSDEITTYGVVYGKTSNPTIEDNVALPEDNSAQSTTKNTYTKQSQTNNFTVKINGLTPGEHYYFRTFATNKAGTAYGEELSIGTPGLAGTSWEITYYYDEEGSWIAHVDFYEDGTAFYTEPDNPGMFDMWGEWSMEGNMLTYDMMPDDESDIYILTGELTENEMSGTYTFGEENRPWTAEPLSSE